MTFTPQKLQDIKLPIWTVRRAIKDCGWCACEAYLGDILLNEGRESRPTSVNATNTGSLQEGFEILVDAEGVVGL